MDGEKRTSRRKHLQFPARILSEHSNDPVPCLLTDISETGARVSLQSADKLPETETVTLVLSTQGVKRRCRIAWREGSDMGMEFIRPGGSLRRKHPA